MDYTGRQLEIIQSSLRLITESGIQGLTLKNLSKEIGISEPAIYRHYESKIAILESLLGYFSEQTSMIFNTDMYRGEVALEKINRIFEANFQFFAASPTFVSVVFAEEMFRNEPLLTAKVSAIMNDNMRAVSSILDEGKRLGQLRTDIETPHLVQMVMGALRLLIKQWQMDGFSFDLVASGRSLMESLKRLLMIPESSV
ncbi:MAG: TetR/AcrR family transcriptional regulator [Bacteroidales bacterium]|nr:TetR/AcrR family transcriptional regulator [Bacteroidales bacterium]